MATTAETVTAARARLDAAMKAESEAHREVRAAELALEEAEGRPESHAARFARAYLANDHATVHRLAVEGEAEFRQKHAEYHARSEAEIARAMQAEG